MAYYEELRHHMGQLPLLLPGSDNGEEFYFVTVVYQSKNIYRKTFKYVKMKHLV